MLFPNCAGRVNVGLEHFRRTALKIEREIAASGIPQSMRETMRLNGVETLEIKHRLDHAHAGRIAIDDGDEVGTEGIGDRRIIGEHIEIGLANEVARDFRMPKPRGEPVDDRALKRVMVQDRRHHDPRNLGLAMDRLLGFGPHPRENGIDTVNADDFCGFMHGVAERHATTPSAPALYARASASLSNLCAVTRFL